MTQISKIGFGGGCHWCTEAVFQAVKGVLKVEQGWISAVSDSKFSEGVLVFYDKSEISLDKLIEIHLLTHSSSSAHSKRIKYRSGIYTFSENQLLFSENVLKGIQINLNIELVTRVFLFSDFQINEEQYQNYYKKNPAKPFCENYIEPKLINLRRNMKDWIKPI